MQAGVKTNNKKFITSSFPSHVRGFPWAKKQKFQTKWECGTRWLFTSMIDDLNSGWSTFHLTSTQHFRSGCTQNSITNRRERIAHEISNTSGDIPDSRRDTVTNAVSVASSETPP